jgi:hypothetical protein
LLDPNLLLLAFTFHFYLLSTRQVHFRTTRSPSCNLLTLSHPPNNMATNQPFTVQVQDPEAGNASTHSTTNNIQVEKPAGPPPPPNGGTKAWLQVLGAFFLNFNTWGLLNAFGVFQAEYSTGLLSSSSQSAISWIGSIQAFLMLVVGVLCGRALDAGYFYPDIITGAFLEVFGMMSK